MSAAWLFLKHIQNKALQSQPITALRLDDDLCVNKEVLTVYGSESAQEKVLIRYNRTLKQNRFKQGVTFIRNQSVQRPLVLVPVLQFHSKPWILCANVGFNFL